MVATLFTCRHGKAQSNESSFVQSSNVHVNHILKFVDIKIENYNLCLSNDIYHIFKVELLIILSPGK